MKKTKAYRALEALIAENVEYAPRYVELYYVPEDRLIVWTYELDENEEYDWDSGSIEIPEDLHAEALRWELSRPSELVAY